MSSVIFTELFRNQNLCWNSVVYLYFLSQIKLYLIALSTSGTFRETSVRCSSNSVSIWRSQRAHALNMYRYWWTITPTRFLLICPTPTICHSLIRLLLSINFSTFSIFSLITGKLSVKILPYWNASVTRLIFNWRVIFFNMLYNRSGYIYFFINFFRWFYIFDKASYFPRKK